MPTITGTDGNDVLNGTNDDDFIYGRGGNDTIEGGDGNDLIDAGSGVDIVFGGAGNDTLQVSSVTTGFPTPPATTFNGGTGFDTIDMSALNVFPQAFWSYESSSDWFSVLNYRFSSVENLIGTYGTDVYNLGLYSGPISISAGGGNDRIIVGRGAVVVDGGSGNDEIDFLGGSGTYLGGSGDDLFSAFQGSSAGAILDGGSGTDHLIFTYQHANIDLVTQIASGFQLSNLTLRGFENITIAAYGSSTQLLKGDDANNIFKVGYDTGSTSVDVDGRGGNDTISGGQSGDVLRGGSGDDAIDGRLGNDRLFGDDGNDVLIGGVGDDSLDGGLGTDTVSYQDNRTLGVTADLAAGIASGGNDSGSDTLFSIENIRGSDFADNLRGDAADNRLDGGAGNDVLFGGTGDDVLVGGSGADVAEFSDAFTDHTFNFSNGSLIVTGNRSGVDTLSGIEQLRFGDVTVGVTSAGGLRIAGSAMGEIIAGTNGADEISGGGGGDTLTGGLGSDTFLYAAASDSNASGRDLITDFETGVDRIDLSALKTTEISIIRDGASSYVFASSPGGGFQLQVNGALQASDIVYGYNHSIYVIGSNDADILIGSNQGDPIVGNGGDDTIIGGVGADALHGGAGRDTFVIRSAAESSAAGYDNYYDFTTGEDRLDLTALRTTAISVLRQTDGSSVVFGNSASGNFQFIAAGHAINGGDFVYGNNHSVYLIGSSVGETIIGSAYGDPIQGEGGDDILIGGLGADAIHGGAGRDTFVIRTAAESSATGYDNYYDFTTGEDRIDLTALNTTAISVLRQTDGSSVIFGNSASGDFQFIAAGRAINGGDFAYGNNHSVFMVGSEAGETLIGSNNADPILGGGGDDIVIGGGGADSLEGGAGRDTFRYRAASESTLAFSDRIQDFAAGVDKIDLTGVRSGANDKYGIAYEGGGSFLYVDIGGDGTNDMLIQLKNINLTAADINWEMTAKASPADYYSELSALITDIDDGALPGQPEWSTRFDEVHFDALQMFDGFGSLDVQNSWML
ncbi:MAG: calcium-binding protein [Brevundimonas sp.]|uniref:calcium-binding protein n=1 Tax=Brevundimonas sp. TaxID=1871086 RepID=UPI0039196CD1